MENIENSSNNVINKKIGFIGFGNMAQAICDGILNKKIVAPSNIYGSGKNRGKLDKNTSSREIKSSTNIEIAKACDIIFLSVKPFYYSEVINEIKDFVDDNKIIVTITTNILIEDIKKAFGKDVKVLVTMPNTPALVGEALTLYDISDNIKEDEHEVLLEILKSFGSVIRKSDKEIIMVGSLNGCSPAFTYMYIEALSDAGVLLGLSRSEAIYAAAQSVKGAAQMVLETNLHPGQLKDMVTSPRGTTIEGVRHLENNSFRGITMDAVIKAYEKSIKK